MAKGCYLHLQTLRPQFFDNIATSPAVCVHFAPGASLSLK